MATKNKASKAVRTKTSNVKTNRDQLSLSLFMTDGECSYSLAHFRMMAEQEDLSPARRKMWNKLASALAWSKWKVKV